MHPDVTIDYESIGSGGGIGLVTDGRVDFGATDGPMTEQQIKTFLQQRGCDVLHLPMALGAVVPSYNLPGITAELKFTPRALAGIFRRGGWLPHCELHLAPRASKDRRRHEETGASSVPQLGIDGWPKLRREPRLLTFT